MVLRPNEIRSGEVNVDDESDVTGRGRNTPHKADRLNIKFFLNEF